MKKTITAILIIALIAVAIAFPSFAANTVYFTSVNNILMQLDDDTMAINYGGTIYLPYSVFNSHELSTFAVYSQSAQIVTVFGNGVQLYFNLQDGTTYDTFDTTYRQRAISSNGRIYLPAAFTAEYFGITYSVISGNKYGTIIRMTVGNTLDDDTFSSAASALMKSRLDAYNKSKATPTPTTSPTPTPTRTPTPSGSNNEDHSNVDVHLSFWGIDVENTPRILSALQSKTDSAAFFVTADEILEYPDLIRRISASGHAIGIICTNDLESDYSAALSLLYDAAHTCTFLVADSAEYSIPQETCEELGLIYYSSEANTKTLFLKEILTKLGQAEDRIDLMFISNTATADAIPLLLQTLRNDDYNIVRLSELKAAQYGALE